MENRESFRAAVNAVMNVGGSIKCGESLRTVNFSRRTPLRGLISLRLVDIGQREIKEWTGNGNPGNL